MMTSLRQVSDPSKARMKRWGLFLVGLMAFAVVLLRFGVNWLVVAIGAIVAVLSRALPLVLRALPLFGLWRRFKSQGPNPWGTPHSGAPPPGGDAPFGRRPNSMSRAEALQVLELSEGASRQDILNAYRRIMKTVHPDHGGSSYLAAKVNEAKNVLLPS